MRTYFLHGKLTDTGFHLTASLCKDPPKGYFLIGDITAHTLKNAVLSAAKNAGLLPTTISPIDIVAPTHIQSSFIKED